MDESKGNQGPEAMMATVETSVQQCSESQKLEAIRPSAPQHTPPPPPPTTEKVVSGPAAIVQKLPATPANAITAGARTTSENTNGNATISSIGSAKNANNNAVTLQATTTALRRQGLLDGQQKSLDATDRLKRSRERNRIHARKTRQRKKEQMQTLQKQAEKLKGEQLLLRQAINEKNTASILVDMLSKDSGDSDAPAGNPEVEALLQRPTEEIPDASKLPELPALILPGHHNAKKMRHDDLLADHHASAGLPPCDGIDYNLLGKDRSKCSPEELDQIRRERNRMHAKRTRDRKRLFMEELADMCKQLEDENNLLEDHLATLNGGKAVPKRFSSVPTPISPALSAKSSEYMPLLNIKSGMLQDKPSGSSLSTTDRGHSTVSLGQFKSLLEAATAFSSTSTASAISASSSNSEAGSMSEHDDNSAYKRRRLSNSRTASTSAIAVPQCITMM